MSQLELLWDYQQADVEAERQENAMKRSPTASAQISGISA